MKAIPLGISVNIWNVVKFFVLELFISVVFASTWSLLLQRASARALRSSSGVCLVPSGWGRFTPAEVAFYTTDRSTARTAHGDAERLVRHRRTRVVIGAVNCMLFGLLFVLEYGSEDLPNSEGRRVDVVTAQSIRKHSHRIALDAGTIAGVPESVRQGFWSETRSALIIEKEEPDAPSEFKLLEHTVNDGGKLVSPGNAVEFKEVCGDNEVVNIMQCVNMLAPFLSANSTMGRVVVARVTRVHAFSEGEHRIYDIALESSIGLADNGITNLRPRGLVGTCNGRGFINRSIGSKPNTTTVVSDACVLCETDSKRVFALFPERLTSAKLLLYNSSVTLLERPGGVGPWVLPDATIIFDTVAHGVLSFMPSVEVDTYTAALSMQQHEVTYSNLFRLKSMDFAPFREYRRHVLLMCLGLFGKYFEQKHVQILNDSQQAAINVLFLVGLAGLVLVVIVLLMASAYMGATKTLRVPVEMRTQLLSIRCAARGYGDANSIWPAFGQGNEP